MLFFKSTKPTVDYIVIGLGNIGLKYENTRHNMGFICIDRLAEDLNVRFDKKKFKSSYTTAKHKDKTLLLLKPETYMNNSGEALVAAMNFYKVGTAGVIVLFDDVSIPFGNIRIRRKGSDGGQKGMRSIIELTGSEDIMRIKVGVGEKPHPDFDMVDWVLSKFKKNEEGTVKEAAEKAAEAVLLIVTEGIDKAMNKFSG